MLPDIEEMVINELNGLCVSCVHFNDCVYRKNSNKIVIQCEVFESVQEAIDENSITNNMPLKGLCLNCSKSHYCQLPKEPSGVWHCEEYQ